MDLCVRPTPYPERLHDQSIVGNQAIGLKLSDGHCVDQKTQFENTETKQASTEYIADLKR